PWPRPATRYAGRCGVFRIPQWARRLTVDVVGHPVGVDAIGDGRQIVGSAERIDSRPRGHDRVHQADTESGHYWLARYASTIGSSSSGVAPCMITASAPESKSLRMRSTHSC